MISELEEYHYNNTTDHKYEKTEYIVVGEKNDEELDIGKHKAKEQSGNESPCSGTIIFQGKTRVSSITRLLKPFALMEHKPGNWTRGTNKGLAHSKWNNGEEGTKSDDENMNGI